MRTMRVWSGSPYSEMSMEMISRCLVEHGPTCTAVIVTGSSENGAANSFARCATYSMSNERPRKRSVHLTVDGHAKT
jgi:hypothetical protein